MINGPERWEAYSKTGDIYSSMITDTVLYAHLKDRYDSILPEISLAGIRSVTATLEEAKAWVEAFTVQNLHRFCNFEQLKVYETCRFKACTNKYGGRTGITINFTPTPEVPGAYVTLVGEDPATTLWISGLCANRAELKELLEVQLPSDPCRWSNGKG
jgi:hypothetical protein